MGQSLTHVQKGKRNGRLYFRGRLIDHLGFTTAYQYKQQMPYMALVSKLLKDKKVPGSGQTMKARDDINFLSMPIVKKSGFMKDRDGMWFWN